MASIEKKISIAANIYNDTVVGNKYKFIYNDVECYISFSSSQFAHLVGVTAVNNNQFFKNACNGTLTKNHYYFESSQNKNNSLAKLSVFGEFFSDDNKYIKVADDEIIIHVSNEIRAVLKIRVKSEDKPNHYVAVSLIRKAQRSGERIYFEKIN